LPSLPTPFIGREREVAGVVGQLRRPGVRLVTLTGPGGVGKTRLGLAAAQAIESDFVSGVVFVSLAATRDPQFMVPAIAQAFGFQEGGGAKLLERLIASFADQHLLLVLDNCEHLLDAAPSIAALLSGAPTLSILATSRMRLRLSGEHDYGVGPMAVPEADAPPERLQESAAVQLFLARAEAVNPDLEPSSQQVAMIAEMCRRLDGLPLAIELAAARVNVLPIPTLLARLEQRLPLLVGGARDLPLRQQTMRDTIAWSYELLTGEEKRLFLWMTVFEGGITLEAAEALAEAIDELATPPVELVASLVEGNLLRLVSVPTTEPRYQMLETIREYGGEQLRLSDEEEGARDWHAAWFLAQAEAGAPAFFDYPDPDWLNRLAADHDNLGAAFDWLCRDQTADACLRLAAVCLEYWWTRGYVRDGATRLNRALANGSPNPTVARGRALNAAVFLAHAAGDPETAAARAREAEGVWQVVDDRQGIAGSLYLRAMVEERQLNWETAGGLAVESLRLWRQFGENRGVTLCLSLLSGIAYGQGDLERAWALGQEAQERARNADDRVLEALTEWYLGLFAMHERRIAEASRRYFACLRIETESGEQRWAFKALTGLAAVAVELRHVETGLKLLGAVDGLLQRTGAELFPFDRPAYERADSQTRAALGEEEGHAVRQEGRRLAPGEWLALAESIVAAAEGAEQRTSRRDKSESLGLSGREREVLLLMAEGMTDREIAERLFISSRTVNSHVASILNRFGVHSRREAVRYARAANLLPVALDQSLR
jgi:predicted ATPase/DNA-binding CsgD family transcriptional regulator